MVGMIMTMVPDELKRNLLAVVETMENASDWLRSNDAKYDFHLDDMSVLSTVHNVP
jgi:hypothetical protein